MSRVGKNPISVSDKIKVEIQGKLLSLKGAKDSIKFQLPEELSAKMENGRIILSRASDEHSAKHGLFRALIQNGVKGLEKGFTKSLELEGVGYRASVSGKKLELALGFSHPISFEIPAGVEVKVDKQTVIHVTGSNKELVGQVSAKIRSFRPPEPYLGKGVRYAGEKIRRKAGKSAGK